jgi:Cu-processing system permease protein
MAITSAIGDWSPDRPVQAALLLAGSVVLLTSLSVLIAVFAGSTAQGIAVLMLFGAGLTAGLLGQIGDALDSETLEQISEVASWMLPFEVLYQDALYSMTAETSGVTGFLLSLGPFGGAREAGAAVYAYSLAYGAIALALAGRFFARRDL